MSEPNYNWNDAPKNGSAINIEIPDGKAGAIARWNASARPVARWEVPDSTGQWYGMESRHGSSTPRCWWPA
jgi:hypothetical protein